VRDWLRVFIFVIYKNGNSNQSFINNLPSNIVHKQSKHVFAIGFAGYGDWRVVIIASMKFSNRLP
jgi:hypothetical protein